MIDRSSPTRPSTSPHSLPYDLNTTRLEEFDNTNHFRSLSDSFIDDQLAGFDDIELCDLAYSELYEQTYPNTNIPLTQDDESFTTLSTETLAEHELDELCSNVPQHQDQEQDPTTEDPATMERNDLFQWLNNDDNITERTIDTASNEYSINIQHQFMDDQPCNENGEPIDINISPKTHILVYNTPYSSIWLNIHNISNDDECNAFENKDRFSTEMLKYLKTAAERGNLMYINYPEQYSTMEDSEERSYWLKLSSLKNTSVMMEILAQSTRRRRGTLSYHRSLVGETAMSIAWDIHHSISENPVLFDHVKKVWFFQYPSCNNSDIETSVWDSETDTDTDTDESVFSVHSH